MLRTVVIFFSLSTHKNLSPPLSKHNRFHLKWIGHVTIICPASDMQMQKRLFPRHFCDRPPYQYVYKTSKWQSKNLLPIFETLFKCFYSQFSIAIFRFCAFLVGMEAPQLFHWSPRDSQEMLAWKYSLVLIPVYFPRRCYFCLPLLFEKAS